MRAVLGLPKVGEVAIKGLIFDMDGTLCLPQVSRAGSSRSFGRVILTRELAVDVQ